jgi:hypothetical protein
VKPLLDPPPDRVSPLVRIGALLPAAYAAAVHVALAQDRYEQDARYVGALFVAAALGLIVGAAIAAGGDRFGPPVVWAAWVMAAVAAAGMLAGFLLSRTVGLPSYHRTDWPAIQVVALVAEVMYLTLTFVAARQLSRRGTQREESREQLAA